MSYTIDIRHEGYSVDTKRLIQSVSAVLDQHDIDRESGLTIVFHDNKAQRALNLAHRQIDAPTDVLSFPADPLPQDISEEKPYLGDLLIAYPYTQNTAKQNNANLDDVFCLLVIHGTLHLLGYDHLTDEEKTDMWSAQADALKIIHIEPTIVDTYGGTNDV